MTQNRDAKIQKLVPVISEAYDYQIKLQKQKVIDAANALKAAETELQRLEKKKVNLEHNIGRATNDDLSSYHFLFFGSELM